jgi:hypothetical protein
VKPERHHLVSQALLRRFAEPGGGLYRWDIRSGAVDSDGERLTTGGVGWIKHFYSLGPRGARDTSIEDLLAREYDNFTTGFVEDVLEGVLEDKYARRFAGEFVAQQMLRTPSGLAQIVATATSLDLQEPPELATRDEVLTRFADLLSAGREEGWHLLAENRWTLGRPPPGRIFVISDRPSTSRLNDWPELGSPGAGPQVTLPITPEACLIVDDGSGYAGERVLSNDEYEEIVFRTAMCADRWVFSHDQGVLSSLAEIASERGYTPRFEQIGDWH